MKDGYSKIFWGFIILTFGINIGQVRMLPLFVGWIVVRSGIRILMEHHNTVATSAAYNLATILAAANIAAAVLSFFNMGKAQVLLQYYPIILMTLELVFLFKIFEGTVEYSKSKEDLASISYLEFKLDACITFFGIAIIAYIIGLTFYSGWILLIGLGGKFLINIYFLNVFRELSKIKIFDTNPSNNPINDIE